MHKTVDDRASPQCRHRCLGINSRRLALRHWFYTILYSNIYDNVRNGGRCMHLINERVQTHTHTIHSPIYDPRAIEPEKYYRNIVKNGMCCVHVKFENMYYIIITNNNNNAWLFYYIYWISIFGCGVCDRDRRKRCHSAIQLAIKENMLLFGRYYYF